VVHVVWFKRDLRLHDHRPLARAAARGLVLPLYIVEPDLWRQADVSARQWRFVSESLEDLAASLARRGSRLAVIRGDALETLKEVHRRYRIAALWSHQETGNDWTHRRDFRVEAWCRAQAIPWQESRQSGAIRGLRHRNGWAKRWDAFMAEPLTPAPSAIPAIDHHYADAVPTARDLGLAPDGCHSVQPGGRSAAEECLESFLTQRGEHYRSRMSSPLSAAEACSRLSAHLAVGNLAMREVTQAVRRRTEQLRVGRGSQNRAWRDSMKSFEGRLHWHCHFMQKLEDQPALEFQNLHPAYDGVRAEAKGSEPFEAWATGQTGLPFVDACMRSLIATGWINFRMRAMLMSVSSYHLWLDWQEPGRHLARQFTDYEPGIHWPQVQMQSGTTGINTPRIYNPVRQGYLQDPQGEFVRRWVPELEAVPDEFLHEPWKWAKSGRLLGRGYPFPVVDHMAAGRSARSRMSALRRSHQHGRLASDIHRRHGSRRRLSGRA